MYWFREKRKTKSERMREEKERATCRCLSVVLPPPFSLSHPLSPSFTLVHPLSHSLTLASTPLHSLSRSHSLSCSLSLSRAPSRLLSPFLTHPISLSLSLARSLIPDRWALVDWLGTQPCNLPPCRLATQWWALYQPRPYIFIPIRIQMYMYI